MAKRSITDPEIALIKAMLARSMKNRDIQFYFNRQDRPVNSGRITGIRDGTYGPEVPKALDGLLDEFLAGFKPATVGAVVNAATVAREPTVAERARDMFEQRGRSGWFLKTHETAVAECKETFRLVPEDRFADPLRSIAGLANNSGGFVFFGVKELPDGSLHVEGLADDYFTHTDPAALNRCLAGTMDPVPVFSMVQLDFDGKKIGAIHVEKHDHPPVIAIKNVNNQFKEGAIYFRYVGETRAIKPGELRQIIAYREQKAIAEFAQSMAKVAVGSAATLDLDTGEVRGKVDRFVIDEKLLPKIQFIREGEFSEARGAPTLKLIGDVAATTGEGKTHDIVRMPVTDEAVLLNFLQGNRVAEPLSYLMHSAHSQREWLPIWYYLTAAGLTYQQGIDRLRAERAGQPTHRDKAVRRLSKSMSAFTLNVGRPRALLARFALGEIVEPTNPQEDSAFCLAVQGLPERQGDLERFGTIVLDCFQRAEGPSPKERSRRSAIYKAACRLDELLYRGIVS